MSRWDPTTAGLLATFLIAGAPAFAQSADNAPLQLEARIVLGDVRGRIDHMAVDLKRQRLFVAELGNDSVGVVDLASRRVIRTISGLNEPQGVGYEPSTDMLYVANGRDGTVSLFEGENYAASGRIGLGSDADNIRIDERNKRIIVGHSEGALTILDPATRNKVLTVILKAHPESFQLEATTDRIFVNLPNARAVAVVDIESGNVLANWRMERFDNYAMAIDRNRSQLVVAFRKPPSLGIFGLSDGNALASVEACRDIDDLFIDAKRQRVYVSCGEGYLDVFDIAGAGYRKIARIPTVSGARTSLFVPELDRLYVAAREGYGGPSAILVFKPGS